MKNPKGEYFYVNEHWLAATGLRSEQVLGKKDRDIFRDYDVEMGEVTDNQAFSGSHPVEYQNTMRLRQGEVVYMVIKWAVRDSRGEPFCLLTLADTIENQLRFREYRRQIEEIINSIPPLT